MPCPRLASYLAVTVAAVLAAAASVAMAAADHNAGSEPPATLRATGLYAPGDGFQIARGKLGFAPQYPLWSDGASKRRWVQLPPGKVIGATNPDAFVFPPGTRLWKEFSHGGRRVETRYMERRADGSWLYASYRWNEAGSDATLVPAAGLRGLAVAGAPGGRVDLPSRNDCLACHESAAEPVLGLSALQLSPDRDPLAPHAEPPAAGDVDLRQLVLRGLLRGLPPALLSTPPRVAAASPIERAALGYLHGNCGHCHNDSDSGVPVNLVLAQRVAAPAAARERVLQTTLDRPARLRSALRIAPGRPDDSLLLQRMRSRHAALQMPPLASAHPDPEGLALIERWIANELAAPTPATPTQEH